MGGTWRVVQQGNGATRPLVVCYFIGQQIDSLLRAVVSADTTILNLTTEPGDGAYTAITALNPDLLTIKHKWGQQLGCEFDRVVILAWSRGCAAPRAQLVTAAELAASAGPYPDAIIALDGIHSSSPPQAWQIDTWTKWAVQQCGATTGPQGLNKPPSLTDRIFAATCTQIIPPTFRSVRATLQDVMNWQLPPGPSQAEGASIAAGVPAYYGSGNVGIWSWPGADAAAHEYQQNGLAHVYLHAVAIQLGFGGELPGIDGPPVTSLPHLSKIPSGRLLTRVAAVAVPVAAIGAYLYWSAT